MVGTHVRAVLYGRQSRGSKKSIQDQLTLGREDVEAQGWILAGVYQDGTGASRFAEKIRDDWQKVLAEVSSGAVDVLWLWESSRGDREAETWLGLLRVCREREVLIRVYSHDRTYDMNRPRDWKTLAEDGIASQHETDQLSVRVRRGVAASARAGRPPGAKAPYGYRRVYDPATGELIGQEPDPEQAPIVAEVVGRIARAEPLVSIVKDLNARGVPTAKGGTWRRLVVRDFTTNVAYIGKRSHKGTIYDGIWEPIVDAATFYAAQRLVLDPQRLTSGRPVGSTRPGKQVHLLTWMATCACGGPISARVTYYVCRTKGCVSIRREPVDRLITDLVLKRLADPDIYEHLRQAGEDSDRVSLAARDEVATLKARLNEFRRSAARGDTTPTTMAFMEAELAPQIEAAEGRARVSSLPKELRDLLEPGKDLRERWEDPAHPLAAKRTVIGMLMEITIIPTPGGKSAYAPVHQRVKVGRKRI